MLSVVKEDPCNSPPLEPGNCLAHDQETFSRALHSNLPVYPVLGRFSQRCTCAPYCSCNAAVAHTSPVLRHLKAASAVEQSRAWLVIYQTWSCQSYDVDNNERVLSSSAFRPSIAIEMELYIYITVLHCTIVGTSLFVNINLTLGTRVSSSRKRWLRLLWVDVHCIKTECLCS